MNDDKRQQSGHECSSSTDSPADQPTPPEGSCKELEWPKPPEHKLPEKCVDDSSCCKCPPKPKANSNCLQEMIEQQTKQITEAEKAKQFKSDLEALLGKAKTAAQEYTQDKYDKLVKQWEDQDKEIVELIRKLVCAVPCWRCIVECYVCPLLNDLHDAEQRLYGTGALYKEVYSLHDLRYWHERDHDAKQKTFQRVKSVLAVWEKPVQAIEKNLTDNAKLIVDVSKALGTDASKVVYDVFMKLVPMHLATAPPRVGPSPKKTGIDKKYTKFCGCDTGEPDDCCGPDVGKGQWSFRQRLIGPQPYLVDPKDYFSIICCLVEHRYKPAKDDAASAEAEFQKIDNEIKRLKDQIENGIKTFEKDAKAAIPSTVKCCNDQIAQPENSSEQSQSA